MKRYPSETPSPPSSPTQPTTPTPKKAKKEDSPKKKSNGAAAGVWTPDKFAMLSERIFGCAFEHLDKDELAKDVSTIRSLIQDPRDKSTTANTIQLGVKRAQLKNQLDKGRSNFRSKFLEWAKRMGIVFDDPMPDMHTMLVPWMMT